MVRKKRSEIDEKLEADNQVFVELFDGLKIHLVGKINDSEYVGSFLPCAKNSRKYKILASEIKDLVHD